MSIDEPGSDDYLAGMSDQDIARFRAQAQKSQLRAQHSTREVDKEAWLRMAEDWQKLAQTAEHRSRRW
jgi:hypothetical protein